MITDVSAVVLEISQSKYEAIPPVARALLAYVQPKPRFRLNDAGETILVFRDLPRCRLQEIQSIIEERMRTLTVIVQARVPLDELQRCDRSAVGEHAIAVPVNLSDEQAVAVALDVFHSQVPVSAISNFDYRVLNEDGDLIDEDPSHAAYAGRSLGYIIASRTGPGEGSSG